MYTAHRGMGVPTQPNTRLTELLDQVRTEFDGERSKTAEYEQNRKFAQTLYSVCFRLHYALFRGFVPYYAPQYEKLPRHLQLNISNFIRVAILQPENMVFEKHGWLTTDVHSLVAAQMQEMELVRQKVYALEQNQLNMKER